MRRARLTPAAAIIALLAACASAGPRQEPTPPPPPPAPRAPLPESHVTAVRAALRWLAAHEDPAGGWRVAAFRERCIASDPCDGPGVLGVDEAVTGIAVEAFLDAPPAARPGGWEEIAARAERWLESRAGEDGAIGSASSAKPRFNHGYATRALIRLRLLRGEDAGPVVRAALARIAEDVRSGTLRDCEVACYHATLEAARDLGMPIPPDVLPRLPKEVRRSRANGEAATYASEAALVLAVDAAGSPPEFEAERADALSAFEAHAPGADAPDVYFAALGRRVLLRVAGADRAERFAAWEVAHLLATQESEGCRAGSWDPAGDRWGSAGGRVHVTAAAARLLSGAATE